MQVFECLGAVGGGQDFLAKRCLAIARKIEGAVA